MPSLVDVVTRRRWELGERTVIGRHAFSGVQLGDGMVSPAHAEIVRTGAGAFRLIDLSSRHGTWIGNQRVTEMELASGDEFLVGAVRLRFEADVAAPDTGRELAGLRAVVELTRAIGAEHDLEVILDHVLQAALRLLAADRGAMVVFRPGSRDPWKRLARRRDLQPIDIVLSTSAVSQVIAEKRGVIVSEADPETALGRAESFVGQGIRSAMYVPLVFRDEVLGVLHLDSLASVNVFQPTDLALFSTIATQAALAVKNATLVVRVQTVVAEETQRLERVVRDLHCGLIMLDADRRLALVNAWAAERPELLGGAQRGDVVSHIGRVSIEELLRDGLPADVAVGSPRRVYSLTASASRDHTETVVVIRDVTEEREREARSAHKERLAVLGQLAGGVAHDFNNLLVVIQSYAGFVEEAVEHPDVKDDVAQIRAAAQRAAELTRQLLAFSRREIVSPRVVDINGIVSGMESMLRRILGEEVKVRTRLGADVPGVYADPAKIEQALMNLVVNARDAMPGGGLVTVATQVAELDDAAARRESLTPGRYAILEVSDTGHGMPPEVAERVFEPFFTTKEQGKGTGLGLATVYGIVTQAGGAVSVRTSVGGGSSFALYLPQARASLQIEAAAPPLPVAGGTETVLLAEDEDAVRRLTKRILLTAGYTVLEASCGVDALAVAARHGGAIQLVVTDLVMPGMSGRDLARSLLGARPDLRVVFMSGYFQESIGGEHARHFVPKPFTQEDLLRRVREALDEPRG